jgi:hypothetical protein
MSFLRSPARGWRDTPHPSLRVQHVASLERFAGVIQGVYHLRHPVPRHVAVDLTRQLDKAGVIVQRLELPGKIEGVEGDAVPAHARPRCELHEAVGFGRRRVDDLLNVNPQLVAHDRRLVDQRDVYRPESVFREAHAKTLRR